MEFRDPSASVSGPTVNAIYVEATGMVHNVPTGNTFAFSINDVDELTISNTIVDLQGNRLAMGNATEIRWGADANRRIFNSGSGFIFEIVTLDNFLW